MVETQLADDAFGQPAAVAARTARRRAARFRGHYPNREGGRHRGRGQQGRRGLRWSRSFGPFEGFVKVYSGCETTPSSSVWYLIIDDDEALWSCGNLAAS